MSNASWKQIWSGKGADFAAAAGEHEDDTLAKLLRLNGYFTNTAQITLADWHAYIAAIGAGMGLSPGDRLFEVGCGSGAFLYPFRQMGHVTDGIDYGAGLVEAARAVLPGCRIDVGEARDIDPRESYEIVASNGVFLYFGDHAYARDVLEKMIAKSSRAVCVLDVNDAACQADSLHLRRRSYAPGEYDRRYAGLDQLYFERSWFTEIAARHGLACRIEPQCLGNYLNGQYRFNVFLTK